MKKLLFIIFSILLFASVCIAGPVVDINNPGGIVGLENMTVGSILSTQGTKSPFYIPDVTAGRPLVSGGANAQPGYASWSLLGTNGASYNLDTVVNLMQGINMNHILNIIPNAAEIEGVQYQSVANALAYIATQSPAPSATNRWGLQISGTLGENIDLANMAYINIIGTRNAIITGKIENTNTISGLNAQMLLEYLTTTPWAIYNCQLSNVAPTGGLSYFVDCRITGATTSETRGIFIYGGSISGGNFTSGIVLLVKTFITGGTFGAAKTMSEGCILIMTDSSVTGETVFNYPYVYNSSFTKLLNTTAPTLNGGLYYGCLMGDNFFGKINFMLEDNGYMRASSCYIYDLSEINLEMFNNVEIEFQDMTYPGVIVGANNELITKNCYNGGNVDLSLGGTWTNYGIKVVGANINNSAIGANTPSTGNFTTLTAATMVAPLKTPVNALAATGTLTASDVPANADTVVIDTVTYTFVTSFSATPSICEVMIGANTDATMDNLELAVNYNGTEETNYKNCSLHPTVSATSPASTLVATAKTKGASGNSIATTETGDNLSWGGSTLTGGVNGTVGVAHEICADASYLYYCTDTNTVSDTNWRRISIGSAF